MQQSTIEATQTRQLQDTPIDIKLRLSALWIATMFVYAYVDIFSLMRADFLESLLDGQIVGTSIEVNQTFLLATVIYILPASLMVYFCLTMRPAVSRWINVVVAILYIVSVALSCIGEEWRYFLLGSAVEIVLFAKIIHLAWRWPTAA